MSASSRSIPPPRNRAHALARSIPSLRSAWYLAHELRRMMGDTPKRRREEFERLFLRHPDPWQYRSDPCERARFERELGMIAQARGARSFGNAVEIGCAEGAFTEWLAGHCEQLLALEFSTAALARARERRAWPAHVRFAQADVERDALPGPFDLIVVTGVLDGISRPDALRALRSRLVAALAPGGLLLVGNPVANEVVDAAWWGRTLIRGGKWIRHFFEREPNLERVADSEANGHIDTLFRKRA